jgi:hypothetical protein
MLLEYVNLEIKTARLTPTIPLVAASSATAILSSSMDQVFVFQVLPQYTQDGLPQQSPAAMLVTS